MDVASRVLSGLTIVAGLACSSLGTCWLYFVPAAHGCCEEATMQSHQQPCGSGVTYVTGPTLTPPTIAPLSIYHAPVSLNLCLAGRDAFRGPRVDRPPPLVLRI